MSKDIRTVNWGTKTMFLGAGIEYRPTQLHLKEDGAKGDKPSFCIIMERPNVLQAIYGQVSLEMLNEAMQELGYKIVPCTTDTTSTTG